MSKTVEPEHPPYWAWEENPDTGQGTVYDATSGIARRIVFSVNTVGLVELPAGTEPG